MINLGKGKAAEIGASTGLGSENNKKLVENDKKAFFNWISADENIATARGGGGEFMNDSIFHTLYSKNYFFSRLWFTYMKSLL